MKIYCNKSILLKNKNIKLFFYDIILSFFSFGVDAYAGWGYKKKTFVPRKIAKKKNLPFWTLEDGFYRSLDLGCNGAEPYSLIIDKTGIYYNSLQLSDLENYLNSSDKLSEDKLQRARNAISFICQHNLSKYNHAPDVPEDFFESSITKVLIVDQTYNDASVLYSGASEQSFKVMVEEAIKQNPQSEVYIKIHPDVLCGKKKGYLAEYANDSRVKVLVEDFSPLSLLKHFDKVYVVSSQMGFDALLLGKEVYCYGMPFYAGWGLTHDKLICERRKVSHTIESLFYYACILYPVYVHPIRKKRCELEDILSLLATQKKCNDFNRGKFVCVGFSYWKYHHARAYLQGTHNSIRFFQNFDKGLEYAVKHNAKLVIWSSKLTKDFEEKFKKVNINPIRMEDGFLRSVGLGSDFNWPYSLVLDSKGIYYNPENESDLENLLLNFSERQDKDDLIEQARAIQNIIVSKGLSKYNVGLAKKKLEKKDFTESKRLVIVPGQVEDDASVRTGGGRIQTNLDLLKTVRNNHPDACIIYKPHPDVEKLNRKGKIDEEIALKYADFVVTNTNIAKLLDIVDEVHTLTSLTGFEALLRNKKVFCYGLPFYAGWGLSEDYQNIERRKKRLTLEELIACTLLLYPKYYNWNNACFCTASDVCYDLIDNQKDKKPFWATFFCLLRDIVKNGKSNA